MRDLCARILAQRKLPVENRLGSGDCDPTSNKIKVMTMKVSKGLEFPSWHYLAWGICLRLGRTRRKRRGCFMWRRPGLHRSWLLGCLAMQVSAPVLAPSMPEKVSETVELRENI